MTALAILAACKRREPVVESALPESATLTVDNQSVAIAMRELSRVTGLPIVVAPSANEIAGCVRISVLVSHAVPRAQLQRLVLRALEPTPLEVQQGPEGWVVRRRLDVALPDTCGALALREASFAGFERRQREQQAASSDGSLGAAVTADGGIVAVSGPTDEQLANVLAGIATVGEDAYTITRPALEAMLADSATWLRHVRVVPRVIEGIAQGVRLFGIRRSSVVGMLGFQNGDTVMSINETPLNDPTNALEVHRRLRGASELRVVVERRGQDQTLTYRVIDPTRGRP